MATTVRFVSRIGQQSVSVPGLGSFDNGASRLLTDDEAATVLGGIVDGEKYGANPNFVRVDDAKPVAPITITPPPEPQEPPAQSADEEATP